MWNTYCDGRYNYKTWGYFLDGKEAVSINTLVNNRYRVTIFNKKGKWQLQWFDDDIDVAKLKGLIRARDEGWDIEDVI